MERKEQGILPRIPSSVIYQKKIMKNKFKDKPIGIAENVRIEDGELKFTVRSLAKTKKEQRLFERAIHFLVCPFHF